MFAHAYWRLGSIHTGLPSRIFHKKRRDVFIHARFIPSNARVRSSVFIAHVADVDLTAVCWKQKANVAFKDDFSFGTARSDYTVKHLTALVLIKLSSRLIPYFQMHPVAPEVLKCLHIVLSLHWRELSTSKWDFTFYTVSSS